MFLSIAVGLLFVLSYGYYLTAAIKGKLRDANAANSNKRTVVLVLFSITTPRVLQFIKSYFQLEYSFWVDLIVLVGMIIPLLLALLFINSLAVKRIRNDPDKFEESR